MEEVYNISVMQFPIIIEKDENGYFATCPSLKGCSTQGDSYEDALNNIKDAIKLYVEDCCHTLFTLGKSSIQKS